MNAVITGATRGIGKAITEKFASEGFNVAICSRSKKDVDQLYEELHQKFPDIEIIAYTCDVSDKKQLKSFADEIRSQWDAVEVLVNNAGIFLPGFVHREKTGTLEKMMKTNLYSAYYLTQYLVRLMIREKHGHIFNMCSTASISGAARRTCSSTVPTPVAWTTSPAIIASTSTTPGTCTSRSST